MSPSSASSASMVSIAPARYSSIVESMVRAGGVLGPVLAYFIILWVFTSSGAIAEDFGTLKVGWGIPTATDISIAWVAAVCVFGVGHAAINYLLLCAVVDDGIGLIIIAVAYPSSGGCEYGYLGLVVAAMVVAYLLRRFKCSRW